MHGYPGTGLSRRSMLMSVGAAASAATVPSPFSTVALAQPGASAQGITTKKLPKTADVLPAIGMGTYLTFDVLPGKPRAHLREIMHRFYEGGGRVIDTSPLYGMSEISVGDFATAMDITDQLFITNKVWTTGEYLGDDSHARRSLEQSMQRLWREKIEVMQVHSLVNVDIMVPLLNAWKQ